MKSINWSKDKDAFLVKTRNVSFSSIITGKIIKITFHPNQNKYPNQKIFFIIWNDYIYLVPFLENEVEIFLKTIIPSRKATKLLIKKTNK